MATYNSNTVGSVSFSLAYRPQKVLSVSVGKPTDRPELKEIGLHYYQFHIGDYRKDTTHLTPIEHFIYRSLLDQYYLDETPRSEITQSVIRRLGLGSDNLKNLENVLSDFFVLQSEGYHHKRVDQEIDEYHKKCVTNKANGIKGGRPIKTQSVTSGNPRLTQNNPELTLTKNQEPLTINHKPSLKQNFVLPDWIDKKMWDLWMQTRKGKKMIPAQIQAQVDKLEKWKNAGIDYAGALSASAENGWSGLFEPKVNGHSKISSQSENDQIREAARKRIFGEKIIESI